MGKSVQRFDPFLPFACLINRYPGERLYGDACRELIRRYEFLGDKFSVNGSNFVS